MALCPVLWPSYELMTQNGVAWSYWWGPKYANLWFVVTSLSLPCTHPVDVCCAVAMSCRMPTRTEQYMCRRRHRVSDVWQHICGKSGVGAGGRTCKCPLKFSVRGTWGHSPLKLRRDWSVTYESTGGKSGGGGWRAGRDRVRDCLVQDCFIQMVLL